MQELGGRSGDLLADDRDTLAVFPPEDQIDELELHSAERWELNEEPGVEETTSETDALTAEVAAAAFQAAVSDAQQEAETQLTAAIGRVRQEEAERHAAELARVRKELEQQYADDLLRARSAVVESFKALTGKILERV